MIVIVSGEATGKREPSGCEGTGLPTACSPSKPHLQPSPVHPVRQLRAIGRANHGDRIDHRKRVSVDEAGGKGRQAGN